MDMDLDPMNILLSVVLGAIGLAYTIYGRKKNFFFLLSGLTLMIITFFTFDIPTLCVIGVVLIALPFIFTRFLD